MSDPMFGLALELIVAVAFAFSVFSIFGGFDAYARERRRDRADAEYRAAQMILFAKQHAALLKRQRAGEGIEA